MFSWRRSCAIMVCALSGIRGGFSRSCYRASMCMSLVVIPTGAFVDIVTSLLCTVLRFGCPGNSKD